MRLRPVNPSFTNNRARDDGGAIYAVRRNLSVINCVGDGNHGGQCQRQSQWWIPLPYRRG